jgi:hypothetical protein
VPCRHLLCRAAQAQTFSAEDLAHRTTEAVIWCIPPVRLGAARVLAAPFYLPIWKGPVDREPICSVYVWQRSAQGIPRNRPVPRVRRFFPSLHPGSSTPRIQKGGTEPRRWPPNSSGSHAFGILPASGLRLHSRSSRVPLLLPEWGRCGL